MPKQIMFKDLDGEDKHSGILLDNGDVICGCCGGIFEADEKGETWELIKEYSDWLNLDEEICGEDLYAQEN